MGNTDLTIVARKGTLLAARSLEVDGRWRPLYAEFWRFTPYLFAQLFMGYEETLITYDRDLTAFRVGIGLSDTSPRTN